MSQPLVGFIGQGFIGKNLADDFEKRGYPIFRYSKSIDTPENRERLKECDIVFIAVPTPTTPEGFNCDILKEVIALVGQ
jgi:predicted dinucleotide-binding enzyme